MSVSRLVMVAAVTTALIAGSAAFEPAVAEAQTPTTFEQVEPGFKGVIGLGMVGAELGFIIPAVAGLHETWAFIVFPVVGAAGGAIGGYFAFEQTGETELSVAALALGMAMIIPTLVITLAATAYDPDDVPTSAPEGALGGEASTEEGLRLEGGGSVGEQPEAEAPRARRVAEAGPGLVRWSDDAGLLLGLPGLSIGSAYTEAELLRYGGQQATELRVPLVSGAF